MKMKRLFSWLMACCMLVSLMTFPAAADNEPLVWLDRNVTVSAGDAITLDLHLDNNPGLYALSIFVPYTDVLECTGTPSLDKDKDGNATVWNEFKTAQGKLEGGYGTTETKRRDSANSRAALAYVVNPPEEEGYSEIPWSSSGIIASIPFKASESVTETVQAELKVQVTSATGENSASVTVSSETCTVTINPKVSSDEYDIEYKTATGGKISGVAKAKAGDEVEVTVTPDGGYALAKLTMNGNELSNPSFTMPAEKAVVEATFEQVPPSVTEYDIEYKTATNGKISGVAKAKAGDEVEVTVTPDDGYTLAKLTMNGNELSNPSFTMPAEKAVVEATFKQTETTVTEYDIEYKTSTGGKISGVAKAKAGDEVEVTVTPDDGYTLTKLTMNGNEFSNPSFTMPAEKAVVEATFEQVPPSVTEYDIEYKEATNGAISGVDKAKAGDKVTVTVTPNSGYQLDTLTVNGTKVSNPFTMPEEKAVVEATFKLTDKQNNSDGGGCYIATSVYGSYDAPEVWTLRRFRDDVLGQTWYGRLFIKAYYATSPTFIRLFGNTEWFQNFFREHLDNLVSDLQADGFESTPYADKDWQ